MDVGFRGVGFGGGGGGMNKGTVSSFLRFACFGSLGRI